MLGFILLLFGASLVAMIVLGCRRRPTALAAMPSPMPLLQSGTTDTSEPSPRPLRHMHPPRSSRTHVRYLDDNLSFPTPAGEAHGASTSEEDTRDERFMDSVNHYFHTIRKKPTVKVSSSNLSTSSACPMAPPEVPVTFSSFQQAHRMNIKFHGVNGALADPVPLPADPLQE